MASTKDQETRGELTSGNPPRYGDRRDGLLVWVIGLGSSAAGGWFGFPGLRTLVNVWIVPVGF